MDQIQIMIIGNTEQDTYPIWHQLNHTPEWHAAQFWNKEPAISHFQKGVQDIVIFSQNTDSETKLGLTHLFRFQEKDLILLDETTDMWQAVNNALHERAGQSGSGYSFIDNPLPSGS